MQVGAYLIAAVNAVLAVLCLMERPRRKNWIHRNVVYLPFYLAAVGIVCGSILSIPTIACAMDGDWMFAFFGAAVIMCDSMMLAYLNCVIQYDDRGFLAKNFWGVRWECSYAEVECIRYGRDKKICFQGHSISIDEISCGGDEFIAALDKGHKRATGKWVASYKRKWDPMNGNVDHPWFYFILWVCLGLFCLAVPVMLFVSMTDETDPADIVLQDVQFYKYHMRKGELCLYVEGEEAPYKINCYKHYGDALPSPEKLCSGEKYVIGTEGDRNYIKVLTGVEGIQYITPEIERQVYRDSQRGAVWFLLGASVAGVFFCYMGIAVGRNPYRYSPKIRRMFYKDSVFL